MKYFALTLLLVLFSFSSCKKKEIDFKFSGNIKASNSGENIANADVKIYTYSVSNKVEALKASGKTDASGNYELTVERSKFETLVIKIRKTNYFESDETFPIDNLTTAETNEISHNLSPKSWTKFILKNASPSNSNDELKIQKVSGKTDCDGCWTNGNYIFNGEIDTVIYVLNDGDTYMKFYWWTYGTNELNGTENFYNTAFDTTSFSIIY